MLEPAATRQDHAPTFSHAIPVHYATMRLGDTLANGLQASRHTIRGT